MLKIGTVGGVCPCEGYGYFDGNPFYFRARFGAWQLDVCIPELDPVDASLNFVAGIYRASGEDLTHGHMPSETATGIIAEHYGVWREE